MYVVVVGHSYKQFNDSQDPNEVQVSKVDAMFITDQFRNETAFLGDLGVIIPQTPFTFNTKVMPVCLDWTRELDLNVDNTGYVSLNTVEICE